MTDDDDDDEDDDDDDDDDDYESVSPVWDSTCIYLECMYKRVPYQQDGAKATFHILSVFWYHFLTLYKDPW